MEIKLNDKQEKAWKIIRENELNINLCENGFFIIEGWEDLNELVALYNSVPLDYIDYGRIDFDRVLDPDREFFYISDILEDWGFGDEYSCCDICRNSVRTSPDSWSWMADYWIKDGELICGDCVRGDDSLIEEYIDERINNSKRANTILNDSMFENLGFKKCVCDEDGNECAFENGWRGQNDNPNEILEKAISKNRNKEYVFDITNMEQFSIGFTLWSRETCRCEED